MTSEFHFQCTHCGEELPRDYIGDCPSCGKTGRHITGLVSDSRKFSDTAKIERTRETTEINRNAHIGVILVSVASPFVGFFLGGWAGVVVGLLFSALCYSFGLRAVTKVREILRVHT